MTVTIFTWIIAICWVSLFAQTASWMRRKMAFLDYFSLSPFLLLLSLCVLRMLFFAEFPFTVTIESRHILSSAYRFLCTPFLSLGGLHLSLALLLVLVWGGRAAWILARDCQNDWRFWRLLQILPGEEGIRQSASFQKAIPHGRLQGAKVIVHPSILTPAVVGFLHPIMLLPDLDFTEDELLGIFVHEGTHYRCGHCLIKCFAEIIQACFWWNPFLGGLSAEIEHALEMQADKAVCKALSPGQQKNYIEAILKVVCHMENTRLAPGMPCCLVAEGDGEKLRQRFRMITGRRYNRRKKWDAAAALLMVLLFFASYAIVLQPYGEPTLADYGMHLEPFPPGCYLIKNGEGYDLYDDKEQWIGSATMNTVMAAVPLRTEELESRAPEPDVCSPAEPDRKQAVEMGTGTGAELVPGKSAREKPDPVSTLCHGNRTAYKYRYMKGVFYRRRWSYTYQCWEEEAWKPLALK